MNIGILSSDFINYHEADDLSYENKRIVRYAEKLFDKCLIIDPSKIEVVLKDKKIKFLYYSTNNFDDIEILNKLDVLIIRRTRNFSEQILDIINIFSKFEKQIFIYDEPESFIRPTSKIISLLERLSLFEQPNSQIIFNLNNEIKQIKLNFPIIIKPTHGYKGRKIKICNNLLEINEFIQELNQYQSNIKDSQSLGYGVVLQEYIAFDEEYRVNVLDGKNIGCVIKINDKEVKNADQGAVFAEKYNKQVIELAEKVAISHNLMFAGVDIGVKNNILYLLECNRNPAFEAFDLALNQDSAKLFIEKIYEKSNTKLENIEKNNSLNDELDKSNKDKNSFIVNQSILYGNLYLNSEHEQKGGYTYNSDNVFKELMQLIKDSDINEKFKEKALSEIKNIEQIDSQKQDKETLSSINEKLSNLNNIIQNSAKLVKSATPLMKTISNYFGF